MRTVVLQDQADVAAWRERARTLLLDGVAPDDVVWDVGDDRDSLFARGLAETSGPYRAHEPVKVPQTFLALAEDVVCHRDVDRFALLYRILWRLTHGERDLLKDTADADIIRAEAMARAVHRAIHRMHACVRFREMAMHHGAPAMLAWFEPDHYVLDAAAPFFVRRFAGRCWSILTPCRSAHWNRERLVFDDGVEKGAVSSTTALERYWRARHAAMPETAAAGPRPLDPAPRPAHQRLLRQGGAHRR